MRKLNKNAAYFFNQLMKMMGENDYLKIDNAKECFMPVIIERIDKGVNMAGIKVDVYSLAHYYKQNGDLVPDPEMTFAVNLANENYIYAMSYTDTFSYKEGIYIADGKWLIKEYLQHDQATFAGKWLKNIYFQQFKHLENLAVC